MLVCPFIICHSISFNNKNILLPKPCVLGITEIKLPTALMSCKV